MTDDEVISPTSAIIPMSAVSTLEGIRHDFMGVEELRDSETTMLMCKVALVRILCSPLLC